MIFNQVEPNFWMVMVIVFSNIFWYSKVYSNSISKGLCVPFSSADKTYNHDQISDHIYMSVLKQTYNTYKVFFNCNYFTVNES